GSHLQGAQVADARLGVQRYADHVVPQRPAKRRDALLVSTEPTEARRQRSLDEIPIGGDPHTLVLPEESHERRRRAAHRRSIRQTTQRTQTRPGELSLGGYVPRTEHPPA